MYLFSFFVIHKTVTKIGNSLGQLQRKSHLQVEIYKPRSLIIIQYARDFLNM